jgi:hypothetical protein
MRDRATEGSAASAVNTDLMADHREERREFPRVLKAVALTGSAAAGDAEVEIYIGDAYVGRITNQRTGSEILDLADWQPIGRRVLPNQKIMARISDAGATNVLVFHFVTLP